MSDTEREIKFNIGTIFVCAGWAVTEAKLESWRKFANSETDQSMYVCPNESYTIITVKENTATITLDAGRNRMRIELPAVLVRAEIARCLE